MHATIIYVYSKSDTLDIKWIPTSLESTTHLVGFLRCYGDFLEIFSLLVCYLRQNEALLGHFAHIFTMAFHNVNLSAPTR